MDLKQMWSSIATSDYHRVYGYMILIVGYESLEPTEWRDFFIHQEQASVNTSV